MGVLGTGASYGGLGGKSGSSNSVYGHVVSPVNFGSGGGAPGGGLLKIHVETVLMVEGLFSRLCFCVLSCLALSYSLPL